MRLPFKEGLTLEIKRLSLIESSQGERQEERIIIFQIWSEWVPVCQVCAKGLAEKTLSKRTLTQLSK